jgi:pseudaminic acid synthase
MNKQLKFFTIKESIKMVDIRAGEAITDENVRSIRPGFGLNPKLLKDITGMKALNDLMKGEPVKIENIG